MSPGFTLVELLVATTLLTIVLAAVYTAFNTSIRAWRAGEASLESFQEARTALALLGRELRCIIPGTEPLMTGKDNEITFYACTAPMDVERGEGPRVLRLRYRLRDNPKGSGKILLRQEALVEDAFPVAKPGENLDSKMITTGREETFELATEIKRFQIEYLWVRQEDRSGGVGSSDAGVADRVVMEEHKEGWGMPQGMRLHLVVTDANAESRETTFTTTVAFRGPTTTMTQGRMGNRWGAPLLR